ncbi:MAG: hypothetical protein HOI74_16935 [Gammaproteobacteria bacterium]|nr:hypothetical protein [Gammaproteobacteria bacterium]
MTTNTEQLSLVGRKAAQARDWRTVEACANELIRLSTSNPEGYFLKGLVEKAAQHPNVASEAFEKVLSLDSTRYDAAIELASQLVISLRNTEAISLLERYTGSLSNSPRYLDMAGTIYTDIGLSSFALPLYQKANKLQPGIDLFMANLAACSIFLGKIKDARDIYLSLLEKNPHHQRNHYQLSRLERVTDNNHIVQMKNVLEQTNLPAHRNIFVYYALAKELEDLEQWDESFHYYKMAGDAVTTVSNYDVGKDELLIQTIMDTCTPEWLADRKASSPIDPNDKAPIFVLGLPRTGTTLTERILASHSSVESIGETKYLESIMRTLSGIPSVEKMTPEMIEALAPMDATSIAKGYLDAVSYLLGDKKLFIEKLPYNFLYIGFIIKAFPKAKIVRLKRNPMDSCFAIYKQPFTWAYKFSYNLDDLGRYFVAHDRLFNHWRDLIGDQLIEVEYESLVNDSENQTRALLDRLGLDFEEACLNFDQNETASTTASSVQVREKIHSRSVLRWKRFEKQLDPLRDYLDAAGVDAE